MTISFAPSAANPAIPPVLVWLRQDLRLTDHEPLHRAIATGAPVLPVYCVDPRHFDTLPSGVPKTGAFRARFLIESLHDLRASCRAIGGDLIVRHGAPETVLPEIARAVGASHLYYHEEVASEETTVEAEVEAVLAHAGVATRSFWGHTLVHPDDLTFDLESLPDVFTQFRTRVEKASDIRSPLPRPGVMHTVPLESGDIPELEALGLDAPPSDVRAVTHFSGGETAALARVEAWMWTHDRLRTYKGTRNGLLTTDDSSKFSPWLAMGCLSPRTVYAEVKRYERDRVTNDDTYWMIFELLWRDYFRFVAAKWGDQLFAPGGLQGLHVPWRELGERGVRDDFARWTSGTTGFPLVDAAMQELAATGYTSNRARQNVASFLTKNLGIDWRAGAEWFESHLVDYDVASNWGNWTYSAGVGNDARGFRYFNIHKQAGDYDPDGAFVKHWLPALAPIPAGMVHRPERLTPSEQERYRVQLGTDYPRPMVDLFASAKDNEARYKGSRPAHWRGAPGRR